MTHKKVKPPDTLFPWNTCIELSATTDSRAVVVALNAIHEQQCVIADLLRQIVYKGWTA